MHCLTLFFMSTIIVFSFGQVRKQTDADNKHQCYHILISWIYSFCLTEEFYPLGGDLPNTFLFFDGYSFTV